MKIIMEESEQVFSYVYESAELTEAGEHLDLNIAIHSPDGIKRDVLRASFKARSPTAISEAVFDAWTDAPFGTAPKLRKGFQLIVDDRVSDTQQSGSLKITNSGVLIYSGPIEEQTLVLITLSITNLNLVVDGTVFLDAEISRAINDPGDDDPNYNSYLENEIEPTVNQKAEAMQDSDKSSDHMVTPVDLDDEPDDIPF